MQTFLPQIKQLLADWYLLTLENPLYAGTLVLSAWLITVFFYSIRIYFLNKKQLVSEQASIKLQSQLDEKQLENKQSEEKLEKVTKQMAEEQQLATEFSLKVEQRNQQIIENIKQLANKFDFSEQLVASDEKLKPEFVWQQQDNIQMQLTERLQAERQENNTLQETYKQEKAIITKQKALIEQLQKNLDLQTSKFTQLEQDLNSQRLIQQQQKNEAEKKLADKLADLQAKHELGVASLVNQLNQQKETIIIDTEVKKLAEIDVQAEAARERESEEISQVQAKIFEPEVSVQKEEIDAEIKPEVVTNESVSEVFEPIVAEELVGKEVSAVPALDVEQEEVEPDYTKSNLDITGKFKSLFAKDKNQADKTESVKQAEVLMDKVSMPGLETVEEGPDYTKSNLGIAGKFQNLFGKRKKQVEKTKFEQQAEKLTSEVSIPEPEETEEEPDYTPDYAKSNLDVTGKFKNLFGKKTKQADKPKSEQQVEVLAAKASVPELEEVEEELDYTKSNLNIPDIVKNIWQIN